MQFGEQIEIGTERPTDRPPPDDCAHDNGAAGSRRDAAAFNAEQIGIASPPAVFSFLPEELTAKCGALIARYHAANERACLADMLWRGDVRLLLVRNKELRLIFKRACRTRSAKQTNESLLLVATTILSLEVLAYDLGGWGALYPAAKTDAETVLGAALAKPRVSLADTYIYPSSGIGRTLLGTLAPSGSPERA